MMATFIKLEGELVNLDDVRKFHSEQSGLWVTWKNGNSEHFKETLEEIDELIKEAEKRTQKKGRE